MDGVIHCCGVSKQHFAQGMSAKVVAMCPVRDMIMKPAIEDCEVGFVQPLVDPVGEFAGQVPILKYPGLPKAVA